MESTPSISVVVPLHDGEELVGRCLDALLPQLAGDDEVVVVDDGSLDRSRDVVVSRGVQVLEQTRRGAYAARNVGAAATGNEAIAFIDPDCVPEPGWLDSLRDALAEPAAAVALGLRRFPQRSSTLALLSSYEEEKDAYVLTGDRPELFYGFTNNMAVRRSVFLELGGFADLPRGSDTVFVQEVVRRHGLSSIRFRPDAVVWHHEIASAAVYFRKVFLYGRYRRLAASGLRASSLGAEERRAVVARTIQRHRLGAVSRVRLVALLVAGGCAWTLGSLSGRVRPPARTLAGS